MSKWTLKAERGSTWLIQLIAWLAVVAGRPVCRALLYPIVSYFVLTDRTARRSSAEFLAIARARPPRLRDTFAHIHSFAATLLDRVYMAKGQFDRFDVNIVGLDLVDRALAGGKGCLLLGSHLGSFDLLMLANRVVDNRRVAVMMRVDPRARLRKIAGIDDAQFSVIQVGRPDSYLRAHETLSEGGILGVLADRVDEAAPSLQAPFFSKPARMPLAPHVLAARSGAPVLLCFGLYEGGKRYRIEFVEFGDAAPQGARGAAFQPYVDRYASLLEQFARRYPLNWFNFYPYWTAT